MQIDKIKTLEEISKISQELRKENKIIVTTNGSFDILHYAHVNLLQKAKNEGDILIVLLNSDSSIKRNKGENRPIIAEKERAKMLEALSWVDYVVIFTEDTPNKTLKAIKPNMHVKGGSFIAERIEQEQKVLNEWGGKFKNFELEKDISTTSIINKILKNYGQK